MGDKSSNDCHRINAVNHTNPGNVKSRIASCIFFMSVDWLYPGLEDIRKI
jgi:hypothetical protein